MDAEAAAVHGIAAAELANAPGFADIAPALYALLAGRVVVVYNADFDRQLLAQTARAHGLAAPADVTWACAMELYAQYTGLWNSHFENYRWQKLADAATWFNLQLPAPRRAACGAETVRKLLRFMAGVETRRKRRRPTTRKMIGAGGSGEFSPYFLTLKTNPIFQSEIVIDNDTINGIIFIWQRSRILSAQ